MKNKHIDTIETVYGVDIVIANEAVNIEDLRELLTYSDGEELEEVDYEACTSTCKYKSTNKCAILVHYANPFFINGENKQFRVINTAAHEAFHVINYLMDFSKQEIDPSQSNEYIAYMMGYYTERIYDTWTKK